MPDVRFRATVEPTTVAEPWLPQLMPAPLFPRTIEPLTVIRPSCCTMPRPFPTTKVRSITVVAPPAEAMMPAPPFERTLERTMWVSPTSMPIPFPELRLMTASSTSRRPKTRIPASAAPFTVSRETLASLPKMGRMRALSIPTTRAWSAPRASMTGLGPVPRSVRSLSSQNVPRQRPETSSVSPGPAASIAVCRSSPARQSTGVDAAWTGEALNAVSAASELARSSAAKEREALGRGAEPVVRRRTPRARAARPTMTTLCEEWGGHARGTRVAGVLQRGGATSRTP
jgi:hypothetical protein